MDRWCEVGTVDELRSGGAVRLRVDVPAAGDGWADGLPGVKVLGRKGTVTELELGEGADDQDVLKAALATGPVREFAREQPTLADLFRSVVTTEEVPA